MTFVRGPVKRCTSAFVPTAMIRSRHTASASAWGCALLTVQILPLRKTRSAATAPAGAEVFSAVGTAHGSTSRTATHRASDRDFMGALPETGADEWHQGKRGAGEGQGARAPGH